MTPQQRGDTLALLIAFAFIALIGILGALVIT